MHQEGIVIAVAGTMATVRASRHSACEHCGSCPGNNAMVLEARNPVCARVGQRVRITVPQQNMLNAVFVVFILPLLALGAGYWLGTAVGNGLWAAGTAISGTVGALGAFGLAIWYIRRYERKKAAGSTIPVITEIIA